MHVFNDDKSKGRIVTLTHSMSVAGNSTGGFTFGANALAKKGIYDIEDWTILMAVAKNNEYLGWQQAIVTNVRLSEWGLYVSVENEYSTTETIDLKVVVADLSKSDVIEL